jgi:hypothetical protein
MKTNPTITSDSISNQPARSVKMLLFNSEHNVVDVHSVPLNTIFTIRSFRGTTKETCTEPEIIDLLSDDISTKLDFYDAAFAIIFNCAGRPCWFGHKDGDSGPIAPSEDWTERDPDDE